MTFEEIETVVRKLEGQGIATAEIRIGPASLKLRFVGTVAEETAPTVPPTAFAAAPSPGRFRPMHPLEGVPRFSEGDRVAKGETIAYVEANGVLLPVLAESDLVLGRALAVDGEPVGWGKALYETR